MPALNRRLSAVPALLALALTLTAGEASGAPEIRPLHTAVIKATAGLCGKGIGCHLDKAGVWIPRTKVAILSVSVAEQAEVALYVNLELSTRPEMYQCAGGDADGCIFRLKYAGPGLYDDGGTSGST
jgi:hypothetical protein